MALSHILIIDDDNRNIFALSAILRSRKYNCSAASGVRQAIAQMLSGNVPDIILMDMMMPDIDGYEGIALLKDHPGYSHIPIIALTAQAMQGDREKCLEAGANGYISKPVDLDELMKLFNRLI